MALFAVAFALNWPWEMLQMPAYAEMAGRSWRETALACAAAGLGDASITLLIYAAAALVARLLRWPLEGGWRVYSFVALLGALCAVVIERAALGPARWSYTAHMPVVPALGVGLWPFLQLTLLVPGALWIAARWRERRAVNSR